MVSLEHVIRCNSEIQLQKSVKRQSDMTLEEMYNSRYNFDDDDDEDSDSEPLEKHIEVVKWFCVNCTMVNLDDVVHCDVCGEHRASGILKRGFFASPYLPDGGASQHSEVIERFKADGGPSGGGKGAGDAPLFAMGAGGGLGPTLPPSFLTLA